MEFYCGPSEGVPVSRKYLDFDEVNKNQQQLQFLFKLLQNIPKIEPLSPEEQAGSVAARRF